MGAGARSARTREIVDGSLKAVDVGKASGTVTLNFPSIAKDDCANLPSTRASRWKAKRC